jgi:hypothetical protein
VSSSASDDNPSVTSVAGPSVVRERMPEIERGMVLAGRYQIEEVLGKGGSGIVLRAFDRTAQMVVAIKVLKQELTHDARWSRRFARELRLGRPIRHPNVCRIFDIGEGDGYRFLTMELATGGTLRDLVKKGGPLRPLSERLSDARAAISGLAAIHEAGIVHRDVKPDNMLRMDDGRLALSDFGLATDLPTAAAVTIMVGTPHYMAPEIRAGEPATTRSDVWALGVALYEIFFGKRPERRSSGGAAGGYSKPPAPLTSTPLERAMLALCERCLTEDPLDRPVDASAVGRLCDAALQSPRTFVLRRQHAIALVVVLVLCAIGGVGARALRRGELPVTPSAPDVFRLVPTGNAPDWTGVAQKIAALNGHVHCFSFVDSKTARLIWGTPRRAQNVDVTSGGWRDSDLDPDTYQIGCPDVSRSGRILFTGHGGGGTVEIRVAEGNGKTSRLITPGSDAKWLRNEEDFLYNVDSTHAAIFSLPTMTLRILEGPSVSETETILDKATSPDMDAVAILRFSEESERAVTVYSGARLGAKRTFALAVGNDIRFDSRMNGIIVSHQASGPTASLALLDWNAAKLRMLGRHRQLDLVDGSFQGTAVVIGRRRSSDVWEYSGANRRRLTSDGDNYSASLSPVGDLLLGKSGADGTMSIWLQSREGSRVRMTPGPFDVAPDFSSDGRLWIYADYTRKTLNLCELDRKVCKVLQRSEALLAWPRFSPDGQRVAYLSGTNPARLTVMNLRDERVHDFGSAHWMCPPVWTSPTRVWSFEGSAGRYSWAERDVLTSGRTGNQRVVPTGAASEISCWLSGSSDPAAFTPKIRIEAEEHTELLRLPEKVPEAG